MHRESNLITNTYRSVKQCIHLNCKYFASGVEVLNFILFIYFNFDNYLLIYYPFSVVCDSISMPRVILFHSASVETYNFGLDFQDCQ